MNIKILLVGILGIIYLTQNTEGGCSPMTKLPRFHNTEISIMQMQRDASNNILSRYNYIFNIPIELLLDSKAFNLKSILSIHNLDWSYSPGYVKYRLSKFYSETAILISFQAQKIEWNKFSISLLINDQKYRPQIYFGDIYYDGTGQKSKIITTMAQIQGETKYTHFVSYFTGIYVELNSPTSQLYQISVNQKIKENNILEFTILVGKDTNLKWMVISYIAYANPSDTTDSMIVSDEITFGFDASGQRFAKISEILPINGNYIFGISQIKFKKAYKQFALQFTSLQLNLFELRTSKSLNFLKVSYFGMSVSATKACSQCPFQKYIYSDGQSSSCLPKCPSDTKILQSNDKICIKCPQQLNIELRDGGCFCKSGYLEEKGRCILQSQASKNSIATFSVSSSDCLDKNSIKRGGQCVCKQGYGKNNGNCQSKCPGGYWQDEIVGCQYCPPETFPDEDLKQCIICSDNCQFCQGINICAFCNIGFINNAEGGCDQICGDGASFISQCDDGNSNDFDGCSSSCQIQKGYKCTGGSQLTQDTCQKIQYLISRENSESSSNGYIVNYLLTPQPELFTTQQLKSMILVKVTDAQAQMNPALQPRPIYYQVYPTQDPKKLSQIKVFIYFGNSNLTFNPKIAIRFIFPNGSTADDTFTASIISFNSYFSTRFSTRTLT